MLNGYLRVRVRWTRKVMASSSGSLAVKVFTSVPMSRFSSTFAAVVDREGGSFTSVISISITPVVLFAPQWSPHPAAPVTPLSVTVTVRVKRQGLVQVV